MSVALVDSGGANIGSVRYALGRLGVEASLTDDAAAIRQADHVILPGVGAAGAAMRVLRENGLDAVIPTLAQPVLGVCLGMQLLYERSEEDDVACLGVFAGAVRRLAGSDACRIPHMGWNALRVVRDHPLVAGLAEDAHAYFVHSYACDVDTASVAVTDHDRTFSAIVAKDNFMAAQFHPERSAEAGAQILRNFLNI